MLVYFMARNPAAIERPRKEYSLPPDSSSRIPAPHRGNGLSETVRRAGRICEVC